MTTEQRLLATKSGTRRPLPLPSISGLFRPIPVLSGPKTPHLHEATFQGTLAVQSPAGNQPHSYPPRYCAEKSLRETLLYFRAIPRHSTPKIQPLNRITPPAFSWPSELPAQAISRSRIPRCRLWRLPFSGSSPALENPAPLALSTSLALTPVPGEISQKPPLFPRYSAPVRPVSAQIITQSSRGAGTRLSPRRTAFRTTLHSIL